MDLDFRSPIGEVTCVLGVEDSFLFTIVCELMQVSYFSTQKEKDEIVCRIKNVSKTLILKFLTRRPGQTEGLIHLDFSHSK